MWSAIAAICQILYLVIKNMFERDKEKQEKKKALYEESRDAIKSVVVNRDVKPLKSILVKLRNDQTD